MTIINDAGRMGTMYGDRPGTAVDDGEAGPRRRRWRHRWGQRAPDRQDTPAVPNLEEVRPGETCRVIALHGGGAVRRRLLDMGIVPGVHIEVVRHAPLRDPIEIRVGNSFVVLRRGEASRIEIARNPVSPD
jgi:ferrous iron transport protein A